MTPGVLNSQKIKSDFKLKMLNFIAICVQACGVRFQNIRFTFQNVLLPFQNVRLLFQNARFYNEIETLSRFERNVWLLYNKIVCSI